LALPESSCFSRLVALDLVSPIITSIDFKETSMRKLERLICRATLSAAALAALAGAHSSAFAQTFTVTPTSPGCQLLSAPAGTMPAFCDTFDKPEGTGNRSGALDGTVWGVSRFLGGINSGQGQYYDVSPTAIQLCGATYSVIDPNDIQICDGQLVEAQFDQTGVTSISMYPKQPFDISGGRTGTIAFDVSDDSHGTHSVWPELWYADKPVPTPFVHDTSLISVPANGFGIRFAATCPANSGGGCGARGFCPEYPESVPVVTVDSAIVVNNYVSNDVGVFDNPPAGTLKVEDVDCVQASSGPGDMNHFEVRVSQNEIDVYGIDAGSAGPLKKIATITNAGLTLTTGLVYLEDNHYNANKTSNGQGTHTFTWDNFAFDGPVLPRDLAFDVPDRLTPVGSNYPGLLNIGWPVGGIDDSTPLTLTVPKVYNLADATAAFLTFNFIDFNYANLSAPVPFISYSINNGSPQLAPFPFGACPVQNGGPACGEYTIAVPVNLSDVVTGANTIQFTASDGAAIANVDLILHGAGGIPCTANCPATLPVPAITITPSASAITTAQALTVAVTVAGSGNSAPVPTGTVTLSAPGYTSASITLSGGSATISIPAGSLAAGPDLLTVSYSGDGNYAFAGNTSSVTVSNVQPVAGNATLLVSPSAYPGITTAQPLTLLIDLYGNGPLAPLEVTGTVAVTGGGYNSGEVTLSGGLATISIPAGALAVGADAFTVTYSGDNNYAAAVYTNTVTITVTGTSTPPPTMTTPTLTITPSSLTITTAQPLTVAVGVAGSGNAAPVPTGTVTLTGGGITSQTVTLSSTGGAGFIIPAGALATGSDTLTASYSGDGNYTTASNTSTVTVTVVGPPPALSFTITGTAVTVAPGASTGNTSTITVTATPACSCSIALTAEITSSPAGAQNPPTLSFGSTTPVSLMTSNKGTATLTIHTGAPGATPQVSGNNNTPWLPAAGAALACVLLMGIPAGRRRGQKMLGLVLLLASLSAGLLGCTSPLKGGTAPGTYTITVTGTSGTSTATGMVTLNVRTP
jgi:hypothetical protein